MDVGVCNVLRLFKFGLGATVQLHPGDLRLVLTAVRYDFYNLTGFPLVVATRFHGLLQHRLQPTPIHLGPARLKFIEKTSMD